MAAYKSPDFAERTAMARAAKQSALDKLRSKPAPDPAAVAQRQAAAVAREAAAAERRIARQVLVDQAKAAKLAVKEAARKQKDAEARRPEAPQPMEPDLKAARDARYAARKARKR